MCPPRVYFPVLCKFWQLYGGVNGDLLQEDLSHTQTQSPCPCSRPLLTWTSRGDAHSSVSDSLGCLGPGAHKVCLSPLSISGVSLTSDVSYLLMAAAPDLGRGVSPLGRWPLQHCAATAHHSYLCSTAFVLPRFQTSVLKDFLNALLSFPLFFVVIV